MFAYRCLPCLAYVLACVGCSSGDPEPDAVALPTPSINSTSPTVAAPPFVPEVVAPAAAAPTAAVVPTTQTASLDPGRVTLHRLNRVEFRNTLRDLLAYEGDAIELLPEDSEVFGFDNIAQNLSLTPAHFDAYERVARSVVEETLGGPARRMLIDCDVRSEACVMEGLGAFLARAWRRPVSSEETAQWIGVRDAALASGADAELAFATAVSGMLLSPWFIYRVEIDPDPTSAQPHPLSGYELASRLSYFLWSSMPDDDLFRAAGGALTSDVQLDAQIERMLADEKAEALVENFAGQWLELRALAGRTPSAEVFPNWDPAIKIDARQETARLFAHHLREGEPVKGLLTADFSFVNQRLALHYGIEGVQGDAFRRVVLPPERRGVLTHASTLIANSDPGRTSIVRRGVWIMGELLCEEPPPVPPEVSVGELALIPANTERERLEQHVKNPACAGCHALFDPAGYGLENYDGIGRYREVENGQRIDASGALGELSFASAQEMIEGMAEGQRFTHCVAEKLMIYALGRGVNPSDAPILDEIISRAGGEAASLSQLITAIVKSDAFRLRRGESVK